MTSRLQLMACAVLAASLTAAAAQAAPTYVSIILDTPVNAPAARAWEKVKGYCDIGKWLKAPCEITSGIDGELGAVRRIAGRIDEVIVAVTPMSYTYADPNLPILYHGTVEVRPVGKTTSKIVYSLFYDQATIPEANRTADLERRSKMFTGVLATMKAIAEAK